MNRKAENEKGGEISILHPFEHSLEEDPFREFEELFNRPFVGFGSPIFRDDFFKNFEEFDRFPNNNDVFEGRHFGDNNDFQQKKRFDGKIYDV